MRTRLAGIIAAAVLAGVSTMTASAAHADGENILYRGGCDSFNPTWGPGVCIWYDEYDQGAGASFEYQNVAWVSENNVPSLYPAFTLVSGNGGSEGAGRPVKNNAGSAWNFGSPLGVIFCVNSYYGGNRDRVNSGSSDYHLANGLWHNEASLFWSY